MDTKDGKLALESHRERPLEENSALWKQTTSHRQAHRQWARLSLLNGAGRDYVETDNFTSLWNKFRDWRMVQGDLCGWITSAANFPFLLQCVLCIPTVQGTHERGWIIAAVEGSSTSKQRETLFENLGRLHSLAHCLYNVLLWVLCKVKVFLCGLHKTIFLQLKWLFLLFFHLSLSD